MQHIKEIHHDWLTLPDGTRLAFRAWLPENAVSRPVPAILEYLPYRKNDGTVIRDEITLAQTAAQGYACVRVDLRGCGESEGLFEDEYSPQELQDGCDVIAWIAAQPWCDGNVGMAGISWGGFNSLQIAALQPPALKAIITLCSTDDRFRDDIHFLGGCLLNDNMDWAAFFWAYAQARAPDPELVGDDWQRIWRERLEQMPFLASRWIGEQTRSAYWQHGSVCEDYSRIQVPVYAMGGWADNYRNTVFSLLANLDGPRKGLVGPWAHKYPNIAYPGPRVDYVAESVRWWDRWLKGIDNGIDAEPQLQYYLQDSVAPATDYDFRAGRWVSEPCWPSPNTRYRDYYLDDRRLVDAPAGDVPLTIRSPQDLGLQGGRLCVGIRLAMEQPADQRPDDAGSLLFETPVLEEDLPIAGQVGARLRLASSAPNAHVAVRLCDVHPDGAVTRVTHGVINLAHRDSHASPTAVEPGRYYDVEVPLYHMAYVVPRGHRLRLAISTAYWPLLWPCAHDATLTLSPAQCRIRLPLNDQSTAADRVPACDSAVTFAGEQRRPTDSQRSVRRDYRSGITTLETHDDFGCQYFESSRSEVAFSVNQVLSIHTDDPLSASNELLLRVDMGREGWRTGITARYLMTCDADNFYLKAQWTARHDDKLVFERDFDETIQRHFM
ncbi:CocE/NonD family hydrolase [Seongchinamella sediminis]|uniref:CocE/NonD family hydrolase n=1 Tax=Seongchinamella sediminis TaxID=2283635 RepID=A0A3L7DVG9_9GAMM|nr:CocE/NonD family hydrolase [Seongchinamella sediminis]RLQ21116.1 CocE/NonD family hydrolase [Seongchinamella sediminis]